MFLAQTAKVETFGHGWMPEGGQRGAAFGPRRRREPAVQRLEHQIRALSGPKVERK
jgi:hypothetical protein